MKITYALAFILIIHCALQIESIVFAQETWTATSMITVPTAREKHTAIWTGTKMIIWGGYNNLNGDSTGGIYDPSTNAWTPTSTVNAPHGSYNHTAIWTGTKMIVWGGYDGNYSLNTGGVYDPSTNTWTPTSTVNAPSARNTHTAIWTGTKMIVWGGGGGSTLNTGGIYDPSTNTWTTTSIVNAPEQRSSHSTIWTGSKMIIWGGNNSTSTYNFLNTGGIYDPITNSWTATSLVNVPTVRYNHSAIWTGTKMIVWGGTNFSSYLNTGGIYDPSSNSWTTTSTVNVPTGRDRYKAIWTGTKMIIWGGAGNTYGFNTGGIYDPSQDIWTPTSLVNAPIGRINHTAIWTGNKMIIWGGYYQEILNTGGIYFNSSINSIRNISAELPSKYSLSQNYPNPFNPISNVKFSIVNSGDVKLVVYDVMGREVQTLVNESLQPGTYETSFDGSMLNSGVYFYKLISDGFTETKRMLLIK